MWLYKYRCIYKIKDQNVPQPWNRNRAAEYSVYNKGFLFVVLYWVEINADEIKQILHTGKKKKKKEKING